MLIRIFLFAVFALASSTVVAQDEESATREDFEMYGNMLEGRWVGDITFIGNWPGESLGKGDKVVAYTEYKWTTDKKVIERTQSLGNSKVKQMFFYDAPAKKIRFVWVSTNGASLYGHLWKKTDRIFSWRLSGGGLADGRVQTGSGETVFSEDLDTHTLQGKSKLDGEDLLPLKDVYSRLSPRE